MTTTRSRVRGRIGTLTPLKLHRLLFVDVLAGLGHDDVDVSLAPQVVSDSGLIGGAAAAARHTVGARTLSGACPQCMQQR